MSMGVPHDSIYRLGFEHPLMVADLLRAFVPEDMVGAFDFDTLTQLSPQYVSDDWRQSRGDAVWRVRFRDGATDGWLYLMVLLEFQSTVDRHMAARILAYTGQMYLKLLRGGDLGPEGLLPPVLPIVIYNGVPRWSAAEDVRELIYPVGSGLAPFQPRQRYLLVDEHSVRLEDLPLENVFSAQIALEQGSVESVAPVLARLDRLLSGSDHASLRRAFGAWVRSLASRAGLGSSGSGSSDALALAEEMGGLKAMGSLFVERLGEYAQEHRALGLAEGREQGLERGLERGREQGLERERALLARQASRKFGSETAAGLAAALRGVTDADRLDEIGEEVIACASGEELLARVRGLAGRG